MGPYPALVTQVASRIEQKPRLSDCPSPQAERPGWYPDPLGSTGERYWDDTWREELRVARLRLSDAGSENGARKKRRGLRLPSLRRRAPIEIPSLSKTKREERALERERQKQLDSIEARREAFFRTPAGKARAAFKDHQLLFQYELEISGLDPLVIPAPIGSPGRETADPVDILNSVVVEGWKLVTGKFLYVEMRGGLVGCYLFKRSPKRRRRMNDPWQA